MGIYVMGLGIAMEQQRLHQGRSDLQSMLGLTQSYKPKEAEPNVLLLLENEE